MDWDTTMWITIATLLVTLATGMRVFAALALTAIIVFWITLGLKQGVLIGFSTWRVLNNSALASIPMFVFMGELIFRGGISTKAYAGVAPILDHLPGGLLHSNIAAGALFAGFSGSSVADLAVIGRLALPEMERRNYHRGLAMGSVVGGGSLANLIPPSIHFIVYGIITRQSIGKLFIAGIVPGLMMTGLYMAYIALRVGVQPGLAPRGKVISWKASLLGLLGAWPLFLLVLIVLGSILAGVTTPTESAAIGVLGAILISAAHGNLRWKNLVDSSLGALKITSLTMLILLGAELLGTALTNAGVLSGMSRWVVALSLPPAAILAAIIIMYLILGCFMSGLPPVIVTLPLTFPVITSLGYDPIWFGVIIELLIEAGLMSPPVGVNLYVLMGLRPNYPFKELVWGIIPIFLIICLGIIILTVFPNIATWLPSLTVVK